MGLIANKKSLQLADRVNAYNFCSDNGSEEDGGEPQGSGHVHRTGTCTSGARGGDGPGFSSHEKHDFFTWTHTSAIKRHVLQYNDMCDDFDMMD